MLEEEVVSLKLNYGRSGCFEVELLQRQLMLHHQAPSPLLNIGEITKAAISDPLDFPDFRLAFVPGDKVAVVIESDTPQADEIFAAFWQQVQSASLHPQDVTLIQPALWKTVQGVDPRAKLPPEIREQFQLIRHDPTVEGCCRYVASTAAGERIYLTKLVTDADVTVTIGPVDFDPVLGVRGTSSSLYPGLSDLEAFQKTQGQGHEELGPEEVRPFRQMVDEIGWLVGLQLSIGVIPAGGKLAHDVIIGQTDRVLKKARTSLNQSWFVRSDERAELVLVTVPQDAAGHSWDQVAAAMDVGRRLVERNGRIVVLSQLKAPPGPGLELLRTVREARDAIKPIQQAHPPDLLAATRIAAAVDWANVSLLSDLDPELVMDLFMLPLENEREVRRLLDAEDLTAVVESGQHVFVQSGV